MLQFLLPLFRPSPKEARDSGEREERAHEHRQVNDRVLEPFRFSCPFLFAAGKKQPPSRRKRFIKYLVNISHPTLFQRRQVIQSCSDGCPAVRVGNGCAISYVIATPGRNCTENRSTPLESFFPQNFTQHLYI